MDEISAKIRKARNALRQIGYNAEKVLAKEFYDYMTGEIFSEDTTILLDVLGHEFIMVHEVSEITELKKMRRKIDKRVIVDSPKTVIYEAHFNALEPKYALFKKDYFWMKIRLKQHTESVLEDDPNLPETMRSRGEDLYAKFKNMVKQRETSSG